ncbi:MAG: VIT family protein [Candidatus Saccharimonadales bacterium]
MNSIETPHPEEKHKSQRANWLRAAILGVDDGIVSTSSIMLGLLAAQADIKIVLTTGIASLVAGAISMAAGEYVSVSSQRDAELADIDIERRALKANPKGELIELADIYEGRGLSKTLALEVAKELHKVDAIGSHARDELGINSRMRAHPFQAAGSSASAFAIGSLVPLSVALILGVTGSPFIVAISLLFLAVFGFIGASVGGGNRVIAAVRVLVGGGSAMAITALIGHIIGVNL